MERFNKTYGTLKTKDTWNAITRHMERSKQDTWNARNKRHMECYKQKTHGTLETKYT